ncbi:MAG: hypothetical protein EZS28_013658 [Streblomastix strix]|uniref:Uncharacterized protein n=1 Tax=Streblomastix strix TaxID=222440 RepID=A0A5J4W894_9EUKA|nr:MAG: hypothetical protein EZS28_013658 [Streblomastix strix]
MFEQQIPTQEPIIVVKVASNDEIDKSNHNQNNVNASFTSQTIEANDSYTAMDTDGSYIGMEIAGEFFSDLFGVTDPRYADIYRIYKIREAERKERELKMQEDHEAEMRREYEMSSVDNSGYLNNGNIQLSEPGMAYPPPHVEEQEEKEGITIM